MPTNKPVYVLIDDRRGETFVEDEPGCPDTRNVTLAFLSRQAAHDYRNRHGLPGHLRPQPFAPDHLDRATQKSMEWYGERATWRLIADRSTPPDIIADRIDPATGEITERVPWRDYYNLTWIWQQVLTELETTHA